MKVVLLSKVEYAPWFWVIDELVYVVMRFYCGRGYTR